MNSESESAQIGLEFYFKHNLLERICDFMLGEKSPIQNGEPRVQMRGTLYSKSPNFEPLVNLLTAMLSSKQLIEKYPLTEVTS